MTGRSRTCGKPVPSPRAVYARLLRHYGPQGWWPTTPPGELLPRYDIRKNRSLDEHDIFEICAGALLTQNTAWKNVEKALANLTGAGLLSVTAMHAVPLPRLAALIRPSGYFNQKARRLRVFTEHLVRKYAGSAGRMLAGQPQDVRAELLSLNGIGPETADSMLLYAGGHALFVVDAYTKRIGSRIGWFGDVPYAAVQDFFHRHLPVHAPLFNEYHALLVCLGKGACRPVPQCAGCPIRGICPWTGN